MTNLSTEPDQAQLANTAAYLAADSAQIDTVELGLLNDNIGGP